MKIKKYLYKFSFLYYLHIIFFVLLIISCFIIILIFNYFETKLSSFYFIILEELAKFSFFLFYQIIVILISKIDFGKLEIKRIESFIEMGYKYHKDEKLKISYSNLSKLRTFIFYSPLYFNFIYFPFLLSLSFPVFKILYFFIQSIRQANIIILKENLLILICLNFITSINSALIYLFFGSKKSLLYIFSFIISFLYRSILFYFFSIHSFNAIYQILSFLNILITIILLLITIDQNIRSNVYVE